MPSKSDPRRLPRRNHYQEGPGFLFLATQGGRPPHSPGTPRPAQVVRRRRAALRRWEAGEPMATICAEVGCSRASLYRWRDRYRGAGLAGLLDRYRACRSSTVGYRRNRRCDSCCLKPLGEDHLGRPSDEVLGR